MLPSSSRPVNPWFVLDSTPSSSRRFAMLTIHALPDGRRRPILIMAFSGWNDAAEAATTAARYLATAFRAEKFAEIDPEEFYHFGLSRPYTRPVRLVGGATDAELAARLGIRPTRYEGPTGIVGALSTICRDQGFTTASLWANVPHYISGIENPKATLALVRRVLPLLGATLDLVDLEDAGRQFDQNLTEIVRQNAKIANYVKKLESRDTEEPSAEPGRGSDLPPASELVAEIEQFLRQQRPQELLDLGDEL